MQHLFNNRVSIRRGYEIPDGFPPYPKVWADIERLNVSSIVGTFKVGETISAVAPPDGSGAAAKVGLVGADHLEIYERSSADFQIGETVTGGTSGATAKVDSIKSLASIPCRLQPYSGRELFTAGKTTVFASHRLFMAIPTVAITEADKVRFGSRDFEVSLIKDWDEADRYYRLDLLEVK